MGKISTGMKPPIGIHRPGAKPKSGSNSPKPHLTNANSHPKPSSNTPTPGNSKNGKGKNSSKSNQSAPVSKKSGKNISPAEKALVLANAKQKVEDKIKARQDKKNNKTSSNGKTPSSNNQPAVKTDTNSNASGKPATGLLGKVGGALKKAANNAADIAQSSGAVDIVKAQAADKINNLTNSPTDDNNPGDQMYEADVHQDSPQQIVSNVHNDHLVVSHHSTGTSYVDHPSVRSKGLHMEAATSQYVSHPLDVTYRDGHSSNTGRSPWGGSGISIMHKGKRLPLIEKYNVRASLSELKQYRSSIMNGVGPLFSRCGITNVSAFLDLLDTIMDPRNRRAFELLKELE